MIKIKAYWIPLGTSDARKTTNGFFILDIECLWWKRSVSFHIHLRDIENKKNPIEIEHGYGSPNMSNYQQPECEIREIY